MRLIVEWKNSTRPPERKTQIELTYRDALLDVFNGVEHARKAQEIYRASPHSPFHDWSRLNHYAHRQVAKLLTASELSHAQFCVTFEEVECV